MMTCSNYDYIEIACMYKYPVTLTLKDGSERSGIAWDTTINGNHEECIILKKDSHTETVPLEQVIQMQTRQENPHFQQIIFDVKQQ